MYHLSSVIDDEWEHSLITKQHHCVIYTRVRWKGKLEVFTRKTNHTASVILLLLEYMMYIYDAQFVKLHEILK